MKRAWVIARMTFLEARRNRIVWSLLFFCIVLVMTSFIFEEVTISAFDRIVRDVGMATISLFGVLLAVLLGVNVVSREIERKTVYFILAKPLSRTEYLLGKLAGQWLTLIVCLGLMLVAFLLETFIYRGPVRVVVFQAFWLLLVELLLLSSFAILTSTFTSSAMSVFMSFGLYAIGHFSADLYFFNQKSPSELRRSIGAALFYLIPNLERLNLKPQVSLLTEVPATTVLANSVYGMVYVAAFFVLAVALFRRRDLK